MRLTFIAVSCVTLIACSSNNGPARLPESQYNAEAIKKAEAKTLEKEKQVTLYSEQLSQLEDQLAKVKEMNAQLSEVNSKEKQLNEQKVEQLSNEIEKLKAEKQQLEKEIEKIIKEKAEEVRVAQNKAVVQKAVVDNGADEGKISYVSGGMISIDGNTLSFMPVADKSKTVNELVIDGKTVTLFSVDQIAERQSQSPTGNDIFDIVSEEFSGKVGSLPTSKFGDDFAQLRYGYIKDKNGKATLFVQGHQTPTEQDLETPFNYYAYVNSPDRTDGLRTLETDAVYRYAGSAFYGKDSNYQQFNVEVAADMVNKKVKVDLKEGDTNKLTFGGNIEGSSFSGNYQGVEAKGAFYGTRGQDIGGLFYQTQGDEKDYSGVFGATKQNCSWKGCE